VYAGSSLPFNADRWRAYYMDNGLLKGDLIWKVEVFGEGPALPEEIETGTGSLSGRLFLGGQPLPDVELEICTEWVVFEIAAKPIDSCVDQRHSQRITTDQDGNFLAENLPLGQYFLYTKIDGEWASLVDVPWWDYKPIGSAEVIADEVSNVGVVSIQPRAQYDPLAGSSDESSPDPIIYDGGPRACMLVENEAQPLACIDSLGQWVVYSSDQIPSSARINHLDFCGDGHMVINTFLGFYQESADGWQLLPDLPNSIFLSDLFCSPSNQLWLIDLDDNVWLLDGFRSGEAEGSDWQKFSISDLFTSPDPAVSNPALGLRFGKDGTAWVFSMSHDLISRFDDKQWIDIPLDGLPFGVSALTIDASGTPFARSGNQIYGYINSEWQEVIEVPIGFPADRFEFTSSGDLTTYNVIGDQGVGYISRASGTLDQFNQAAINRPGQLSTDAVEGVATDDANRIWVGTTWGLNVIEEAANVTIFQSHTSPLPDNTIIQVEVHQTGPPLPALIEREPGDLSGSLYFLDQPMANVTVSLCVGEAFVSFGEESEDPCQDQPFQRSETTDSEGRFLFEALPQGSYRIFAAKDDIWARVSRLTRLQVNAGEATDMGVLTLTAEDFE
ncbi:MAG: carboxypeptidase-like regulatory domain-containing protein, partial [Chloroflexota bacterium]